MSLFRSLAAFTLGASLPLVAADASGARENETAKILSFLRDSKVEGIRTNWDFAYASLPASRRAPRMVIAYLTNTGWCGTGGCGLLILAQQKGRYHLRQTLGVFEVPITFVGREKDGFPILGVQVKDLPLHGVGAMVPYPVTLAPKNGVYPQTVYNARRHASRANHGSVLISETAVFCNFRRLPVGPACNRLLRQDELETPAWIASHSRDDRTGYNAHH